MRDVRRWPQRGCRSPRPRPPRRWPPERPLVGPPILRLVSRLRRGFAAKIEVSTRPSSGRMARTTPHRLGRRCDDTGHKNTHETDVDVSYYRLSVDRLEPAHGSWTERLPGPDPPVWFHRRGHYRRHRPMRGPRRRPVAGHAG